jgi:hypothetical protein
MARAQPVGALLNMIVKRTNYPFSDEFNLVVSEIVQFSGHRHIAGLCEEE